MKRILLVLVIFIISIFSLVGCNHDSEEKKITKSLSEMFYIIDLDVGYNRIFVHKETKVMYLFIGNDQRGGLCVMVDENGKPLLWEGE